MHYTKRKYLLILSMVVAAAVSPTLATELTPIAQIRFRHEAFHTLETAAPGLDNTYHYGVLRARGGVGLREGPFEARFVAQALAGYDVPDDASFGSGRTVFTLSDRDKSPSAVDLLELTLGYKNGPVNLAVGRQGFKDLPESPTGNERLDWLRKSRLSERLVGMLEWTHLGRRFHGVTGSVQGRPWDMNASVGQALHGGFDADDAYQSLDDVQVGGVSAGVAKNPTLKNTDVRAFAVLYRDDRRVARASAGDDIDVDTFGLSLATLLDMGAGVVDLVAWAATQRGDYGNARQRAGAYLLEVGYGLPKATGSPWLRAGINHASGDDNAGDDRHETFFNVLPTNHKFYGIQDLNAFQNLIDTFLQLRVKPAAKLTAEATIHEFRRSESGDAWYGGSGAVSDEAFGFDARSPGSSAGRDIGTEFDVVTTWQTTKYLSLELGLSHFEGGRVARRAFPNESDATFGYFQLVLQR